MRNIEKKNGASNACDRKEDLTAYLYNEVSDAERGSFERHLDQCDSCRSELQAFSRVRDDLSTWQVVSAPRTEIALPNQRGNWWRGFTSLFPAWARGAALTAAATALLLFALSFAGAHLNLKNSTGAAALQTAMTSEQVEKMVKEAVAKERIRMEEQYQSQMASFKEQLDAEQRDKLRMLHASHEARIQEMEAGLKAEIRKANRRNSSIRSFFAMDDNQDQ